MLIMPRPAQVARCVVSGAAAKLLVTTALIAPDLCSGSVGLADVS